MLSSSLSCFVRCSRGTLGQASSWPRAVPAKWAQAGHRRALGSGLAWERVRACASAQVSFLSPSLSPFIHLHKT